jgi:hypothetical protein
MGHYRSYLPSAAQQMLPGKININTWKILKYTSNQNPQTAIFRFSYFSLFPPGQFLQSTTNLSTDPSHYICIQQP